MDVNKIEHRSFWRLLAISYLIALHGTIALVLWKSDFIPKVLNRLSPDVQPTAGQPQYEELLALFPEDQQGIGIESKFASEEHQPMTYGLVLSAESIRYSHLRTDEGARRIRNAWSWLIKNQDADSDKLPGWGLPVARDILGDGTVNQPNHPYTITTAHCLNGLLDSLQLQHFWSESEELTTRRLIADVAIRWSQDVISKSNEGAYFWYSPSPNDDIFCPNVSSMLIGCLVRILKEQSDIFSNEEAVLVEEVVDQCAAALIATAKMRYSAPYWRYFVTSENKAKDKANDALHHAYILWGIEIYRDFHGNREIPWSRTSSIESMDRFWRHGRIWELPQDINADTEKARLWSAGMPLAFYARFGNPIKAERILKCIARDYRWPKLTQLPNADSPFVSRHAAHVLFGMAHLRYGNAIQTQD